MSALGDFLERLYGAGQPFATVSAKISEWEDVALAKAAGNSRSRIGRHRIPASDQVTQRREVSLAAWLRLPREFRLERTTSGGGQTRDGWQASDGESIWSGKAGGEVTLDKCRDEPRHSIPVDIGHHFSAELLREIIAALALAEIGTAETAGRTCVRLRATPRPDTLLWSHWLPHGADYYELHADPLTGTLLYIAAYQADQIFEVNEVAEVYFDEALSDELFRYSPPPGEIIRPATPITERMSLADAIARAPFTVLIPQRLSSEAKSSRQVMFEADRSGPGDSLVIFYGGGLWVRQGAQPDAEMAELEFETVEHQGRTLQISDPGTGDGYLVATLEQDGTHVQVMFRGERSALLEMATSLAPAQGHEP